MNARLPLQLKVEQGGGHGTIRNTLNYSGNYWHDRNAEGETASGPFFYRSGQDLVGKVDHLGMFEDWNLSLMCINGMVVIKPLEVGGIPGWMGTRKKECSMNTFVLPLTVSLGITAGYVYLTAIVMGSGWM